MKTHEQIYWEIQEAVFCDACMAGLTVEQASRYAHIYAVKMTHITYLGQFND